MRRERGFDRAGAAEDRLEAADEILGILNHAREREEMGRDLVLGRPPQQIMEADREQTSLVDDGQRVHDAAPGTIGAARPQRAGRRAPGF